MRQGIDLSVWNGNIDFSSVKNYGIEFCILRTGFGSPMDTQIDKKFVEYYNGATAVGLPTGAYHYGYATSVAEAQTEADFCLSILNGRAMPYGVWYDIEEKCMFNVGRDQLTAIANAFCERIQAAGYKAGVYMSLSPAEHSINMNQVPYYVWIAQYNSSLQYSGHADIWQYASDGTIPGIPSSVDMNYCYTDFDDNPPAPTPTGYEWVWYDDPGKWALKHDGKWVYNEWAFIDNAWYRIDGDGWALRNTWFQETDGNWFYLNDSCSATTGWLFVDNEWYYFDDGGRMVRSQIIDKKYFIQESGIMLRNKTLVFNDSGEFTIT